MKGEAGLLESRQLKERMRVMGYSAGKILGLEKKKDDYVNCHLKMFKFES